MSSEVISNLGKLDPATAVGAALGQLEKIAAKRGRVEEAGIPGITVEDLPEQIVRAFIFGEPGSKSGMKKKSALQELQMLETVVHFFKVDRDEFLQHSIFRFLFGKNLSNTRKAVMFQLISMAISLQDPQILNCVAVWMQQNGCSGEVSLQLAESIVNDYCVLVPGAANTMRSLPMLSPHFTCNLLTSLTQVYHQRGIKRNHRDIPSEMLELVTGWLENDPKLCLVSLSLVQTSSLVQHQQSSLWTSPTKSNTLTPFPGLMRWCVKAPLTSYDPMGGKTTSNVNIDSLWSRLHLVVLRILFEFPSLPGANQLELLTLADMNRVIKEINNLAKEFTGKRELDELSKITLLMDKDMPEEKVDAICLAYERMVQFLQVSLKTGGFRCSLGDLQAICNSIPRNRLLDMVAMEHLARTPPPMHFMN